MKKWLTKLVCFITRKSIVELKNFNDIESYRPFMMVDLKYNISHDNPKIMKYGRFMKLAYPYAVDYPINKEWYNSKITRPNIQLYDMSNLLVCIESKIRFKDLFFKKRINVIELNYQISNSISSRDQLIYVAFCKELGKEERSYQDIDHLIEVILRSTSENILESMLTHQSILGEYKGNVVIKIYDDRGGELLDYRRRGTDPDNSFRGISYNRINSNKKNSLPHIIMKNKKDEKNNTIPKKEKDNPKN